MMRGRGETRLLLVRHGPTHARGMIGWTDLPADLSDRAALARLSAALPPRAAVVSSDLIRARATAEAIAAGRPRLPDEPDLREMHFGRWEGRRHDEIAAEEPDALAAFHETPGACRAPGGESWDDLVARVNAAIDRLLASRRGEALIVVAHFGVILTQIARAAGIGARAAFGHHVAPLSLTEIAISPADDWQILRINHHP